MTPGRRPHDIEPLVPEMPSEPRTDGGRPRRDRLPERRTETDGIPADRHREEVAPLVPDLR